MASEIVLELRQADGITVEEGHYVCTLPRPIQINEGDEVSLRSAFVDSRATGGGVISLADPVPCSLNFVVWAQDHDSSDKTYGVPANATMPGYFLGCKGSTTPAANLEEITQIQFEPATGNDRFGGCSAAFNYVNAAGDAAQYTTSLPIVDKPGGRIKVNPGVVCENNTFVLSTPKAQLKTYNVLYDGVKQTKPVSAGSYVPVEFNYTFSVPAGNWDPSALGQYISTQLSRVASSDLLNKPVQNNFLHDGQADFDLFLSAAPISNGDTNDWSWSSPFWAGASELALEWQEDQSRYQWTFAHLPIQTSGDQQCLYIPYKTQHWIATAHSGIAFTAMEPHSFWEDLLGFDIGGMCAQITSVLATTGSIAASYVPRVTLTPGINTIEAFRGLALAVIQGATFAKVVTPPNPIETDVTTPISAANSALLANVDSHYLIEVNAGPHSDLRGAGKTLAGVRAVVGRFQSFGSFTQAQQADALNVVHSGVGLQISRLDVRILAPDGTLAQVGSNNCIYLSLYKAPPPVAAPEQKRHKRRRR